MAKQSSGPQVTVRVKGVADPRKKGKVIGQPIVEGATLYKPGETLTLSADRADALQHIVELVGPVQEAPEAKKAA